MYNLIIRTYPYNWNSVTIFYLSVDIPISLESTRICLYKHAVPAFSLKTRKFFNFVNLDIQYFFLLCDHIVSVKIRHKLLPNAYPNFTDLNTLAIIICHLWPLKYLIIKAVYAIYSHGIYISVLLPFVKLEHFVF